MSAVSLASLAGKNERGHTPCGKKKVHFLFSYSHLFRSNFRTFSDRFWNVFGSFLDYQEFRPFLQRFAWYLRRVFRCRPCRDHRFRRLRRRGCSPCCRKILRVALFLYAVGGSRVQLVAPPLGRIWLKEYRLYFGSSSFRIKFLVNKVTNTKSCCGLSLHIGKVLR